MTQPRPEALAAVVIDAGGRYGMHPSWTRYRGELCYVLFEPEEAEASRLTEKYRSNPEVSVQALALGERDGKLMINVLRHRGQSTAFSPNADATWFKTTRSGEGAIVDRYEARMTTVDLYCEERGLIADFLKIDTEGSELAVLEGARRQLAENVLGVRCELQFDDLYLGAPGLPEVFSCLKKAGFTLLNLDYSGAGSHFSPFFDSSRYGMLSGCDSVWVRKPADVLDRAATAPERLLKFAAFCMHNDSTDLAVHMLLEGIDRGVLQPSKFAASRLLQDLDISVQRLFYRLSHKPRYDFAMLDDTYHRIFSRRLKAMHEFYQSDEVNPS